MAQPTDQSPRNSWDFLPPSFFHGASNSSRISALSQNDQNHAQYPPTISNPFPGQDDQSSSVTHQDHPLQPPFSANTTNGTNSKAQSRELLELLLHEASPTKQKIQENILKEVKAEVMRQFKDTFEEIKNLKADVKRLKETGAEMEKLWNLFLKFQQQNPFAHHDTKTPH